MTIAEYQRLRRTVLGLLIVFVFAGLLFVRSAWSQDWHEGIEAAGLGLIVIGIIGRMWCTLYIGGRKSAQIVDIGPYSVSRNPLYVFSAVSAAGVGAQTGSLILAAVFLFGCVTAFHVVIAREEAYLRSLFGEPYEDYLKRVPRFWPRFGLFHEPATITVRPDRIYRTFGDGLVFLVALPAFELVEYLQNAGTIGTVLHLY